MEAKLFAMIMGLALVIATVYTQSAFALNNGNGNGAGSGNGQNNGNGVNGGHVPPGCGANPNVFLHNQNCPR